ncbi:MAG: tetratricopeptide repeat protein [Candidatus Melainabacteria bacterium]|nr:tetratricopeptide repeat protein [Candidatus Melainabacteria bacterium]
MNVAYDSDYKTMLADGGLMRFAGAAQYAFRFVLIGFLSVGFASTFGAELSSVDEQIKTGDSFMSEDKLEEAIESYRQAVRLSPDSAKAHQRLGNALGFVGDLDGAAREGTKAIQLDPANVLAHANLGWVLGMQKRYYDAAREELAALKLDPNNASAYLTLGLALASLGDYDGAVAANSRAIQLEPDNLRAFINLGATLGRKGDFAGAVNAYQKALEINPQSLAAQLGLGAALGRRGDLIGQVKHFRHAVKLAPTSDSAHGKLGWALYRAGDLRGAVREGCITNWLRLKHSGLQYLQFFVYMWAGVFLFFGAIFAVIFLGSTFKPEGDELVIKSYFLTFYKGKPGRFAITNKRMLFIPEAFSRWFGAQAVCLERIRISKIDPTVKGRQGLLKVTLVDGANYDFTMPLLVHRALVGQLEKTSARTRLTTQFAVSSGSSAVSGVSDGREPKGPDQKI